MDRNGEKARETVRSLRISFFLFFWFVWASVRYRLQLHAIRASQYLKEIRSPCHQSTMANMLNGINIFDGNVWTIFRSYRNSDGLVGCIEMCKQSVNRFCRVFRSDDVSGGGIPNHIFVVWIIANSLWRRVHLGYTYFSISLLSIRFCYSSATLQFSSCA